MTSGASATNSAACLRMASALPPPQRESIRTLRPSVQPNCCSPCTNAAKRRRASAIVRGDAHEHADAPHPLALLRARRKRPRAAAPPSSVMNSRRLIRSPRRRGRAASAECQAERLGGLEVDDETRIWSAAATGRSAGFSPLRMRPA